MTISARFNRNHILGIALAIGVGLIIAFLWLDIVPWIEQTTFSELATLCFVGLAAVILSLGERLWARLSPPQH